MDNVKFFDELPEDGLVPISLRVDADVLAWYRATGRGWQTRMKEVLKAHTLADNAFAWFDRNEE